MHDLIHFFIHWCFIVWLIWVGANLVLFLLGVLIAEHSTPAFDGFRIHIPAIFRQVVNEQELAAAIKHEEGHRARGHVWENMVRLFLFMPVSAHRRFEQELEADDHVQDAASLASFLLRTSHHPFDLYRAARLTERAKQGSQQSERPYERDAR